MSTLVRLVLLALCLVSSAAHAILVNVTRGEIVRGEDVLAAVDEGLIWGAGLDVTDPEPLPKEHPLWRHPGSS